MTNSKCEDHNSITIETKRSIIEMEQKILKVDINALTSSKDS